MRRAIPILVLAILIAGCTLQTTGNIYADPTRIVVQLTKISADATATAFSLPGQGNNPLTNVKENHPNPGEQPTATAVPAVIAMTGATDTGGGVVQVNWSAVGSFPNGFKVLYDKINNTPSFSVSPSQHIGDGNARSAYLSLEQGKTYYLRVCRFTGSGCDMYSDVLRLDTAALPTATPIPLASLKITGMNQLATGKATMYWNATGSFPYGFKIVQSETNSQPVYPGNESTYISNGTLRTATVTGTAGHTYYFRICQFDGNACTVYSPTYTFTFAAAAPTATTSSESITITGMNQAGTGKGTMFWKAVGSFPYGFKIAWSETNPKPTYPENTWIYVSDGALRTAEVTGTPGRTYYFRVCKYDGSKCLFYSPTYTWAFASAPEPTLTSTPDTSSITITGATDTTSGNATLYWKATGDFPLGFKIAYSTTNPNPVYPGDSYYYFSDPTVRSAGIIGTPGSTVYYRVCKYLGGACGVYSNSYAFTFAAAPEPTPDTSTISLYGVTPVDASSASATWSCAGDFPDGFKLLWSSIAPPTSTSDAEGAAWYDCSPGTLTGLISGTTYYVTVCKWSSSGCTSVVSNAVTYPHP